MAFFENMQDKDWNDCSFITKSSEIYAGFPKATFSKEIYVSWDKVKYAQKIRKNGIPSRAEKNLKLLSPCILRAMDI